MKIGRAWRVGIVWAISLQLLFAPLVGAFDLGTENNSSFTPVDHVPSDLDVQNSTNTLVGIGSNTVTDVNLTISDSGAVVSTANQEILPMLEPKSANNLPEDEGVDGQDDADTDSLSRVVITQVQTTGGTDRTGEDLIEIRNNSDADIDITGWQIIYTRAAATTSYNVAKLMPVEPDVGWRLILPAGATYLLTTQDFITANDNLEVDQTFSVAVASSGGRLLVNDSEANLVSGLAWGKHAVSVEGEPLQQAPEVIDRKLSGEERHQDTGDNNADFQPGALRTNYVVGQAMELFDACLNIDGIQPDLPAGLYRDELSGNCTDEAPVQPNNCEGLIISELGANLAEQFIEVHNPTEQPISLTGCRLLTNRSDTKHYQFSDEELAAGEYRAVKIPDEADLTLTKTTSGTVYLVSEDGENEVDTVAYANLSSGTSWALIDDWRQTYLPTPDSKNIYQQFLPCEDGYLRNQETGRCNKIVLAAQTEPCAVGQYRNPETGRCRMIDVGSSLAPCRDGQYRHPETNRCRNIETTVSSLVPCRPGQERNPETNRCRAIDDGTSSLQPCQDGWERNPDTNRCRKVATLAAATLDYPVEPLVDAGKGFAAWWALGGVTLLGAGYGAWEWRRELAAGLKRVGGMMGK